MNQEGTGEFYDPKEYAIGITYAKKFVNWFSFGTSLKYISSKIWHNSAGATALDLGVLIRTPFFSITDSRRDGLRIGMSISNYGTKMQYDGIDLPYFAVGGYGSQFSNASIHIEANNCLNCHRSSMELAINVFDGLGHVLVNEFMPPDNPGSLVDEYHELIDCYVNGTDNTEGCNWIIPPGGNCDSEIIGLDDSNIIGDLNGDSTINVQDIILTINLILNNEYNSLADLNFDDSTDVLDIILLVNIITE